MSMEHEHRFGIAPPTNAESCTPRADLPISTEKPTIPEVFVDPEATAAWFAGVLEIGATAFLSDTTDVREGGRRVPKSLPGVHIHSTSEKTIDVLYAQYGGTRQRRVWKKHGKIAAEIVASIEPFAVARKGHARAMQRWLAATTPTEQVEIAKELQATTWQAYGNKEVYKERLVNPIILAGVLDSRGYIARRQRDLYIEVTSKNTELLYALSDLHGGRVRITDEKGTLVDHESVSFETTVDSYVWETFGSNAIDVVRTAAPYLQGILPDSWDYRKSAEIQRAKNEEDLRIIAYVREEMKQFEEGKIGRISSDFELTRKLNIGIMVLRRAFRSFPSVEQIERRKIISQLTGRKFDILQAKEKAAYIAQEVREFQEGKRDTVSVTADLVTYFGVGEDVITLYILPQLSPDVYQMWRAILNSQGARRREANKRVKRLELTS
jgi:hypothetical protein